MGLAAVVVGSLALRIEQLGTSFWMDEGISVGIASHPLRQLPHLLTRDGSPPLYYALLHLWMPVVGRSEEATHSLSLLFALATIPVGLWAGWSLFGPRAGWITALLAATSPFLTEQSGETRMYTLVVLLALVATAAFLHAFAFGRRRYAPLFFGSLVLLLYTHNWALYFALASAVALVPCLMATKDKWRLARDAVVGFGLVGLLYLPWVPTLLAQARHTGAPWSRTPVLRETVSAVANVLGDEHERVLVALVLTAGVVLFSTVRRFRTPEGAAVGATGLLASVTLGAAWLVAQTKPGWSPRYFAMFLSPILVLAGVGLARSGRRGAVALALILLFWIQPIGRLTGARPHVDPNGKALDKELAQFVRPHLQPGDLVVAIQMEEVPVLRYYLGPHLRFADPLGPVADPQSVDWRDAVARLRGTSPERALVPLVDSLPVDGHVLLACPPRNVSSSEGVWFELMRTNCETWKAALRADPRLEAQELQNLDRLNGLSAREVGQSSTGARTEQGDEFALLYVKRGV